MLFLFKAFLSFFQGHAVIILPFFTNLSGEKLHDLKNALDQLVAFNFPMSSDEFPKGTLKHNNYVDCTKKVSIFQK